MMRRLAFVGLAVVLIAATTPLKTTPPIELAFPIAGATCAAAACKAHVLVPKTTASVATGAAASCPKYDWSPPNAIPSHPPLRFAGPINIGNLPTLPPVPLGASNADADAPIAITSHETKTGSEILMTVSHCTTVAGHVSVTTQIVHVPIAKGTKVTVDTYRAALPKR